MLQSAFDSGITIVRFPAGSWGDENDLQSYQIDTFMGILQKMDATALIDVRLENGTPGKAAELVRYVNIERKYNVRYWAIGNEPTLYTTALHTNYDTPQFNRDWRATARAMKSVDPTIQLVGPELHQFTDQENQNPKDSAGRDWMTEFLKANGDLVDIVSFHRYPFPVNTSAPPATIEELHRNVYQWDKIVIYLRALIQRTTGRDLPIAVTEFNSHYNKVTKGEATPDSHYNAIWLADVLGRILHNRVFMANQWMLTDHGDQGGWGLIGYGEVRPSYYVYQLYKLFGREQIYSSSDDPDLSINAATRSDGTVTIIVINLSLNDKIKPIRIEGQSKAPAEAWLFDPTHKAKDIGAVNLSNSITFPAQSMTLFTLNP
jgi:alpha-L-arabinofuranosidase